MTTANIDETLARLSAARGRSHALQPARRGEAAAPNAGARRRRSGCAGERPRSRGGAIRGTAGGLRAGTDFFLAFVPERNGCVSLTICRFWS